MRIIRLCHTLVQVSAVGFTRTPQSASEGREGGGKEGGREGREKKEMCRIYRQTDLNPFRSGSVPHVLLHWALCFFFPSSSYNRYQTHTHTHTWMAAPPAVVRRDGSAERTISSRWTNPQSNRRFLFFLSFYSFFFFTIFFFVFVLTATEKSLISSTTQTRMAEHVVVPRWCHQWAAVHRWFNFTRPLASRHQSQAPTPLYTTTQVPLPLLLLLLLPVLIILRIITRIKKKIRWPKYLKMVFVDLKRISELACWRFSFSEPQRSHSGALYTVNPTS